MRSLFIWQALSLLLLCSATPSAAARNLESSGAPEFREVPRGLTPEDLDRQVISSRSTGTTAKSGQRFYLYGAPGTLDGTFQTSQGVPDWQGWATKDYTYDAAHWHVSDFNAANLNENGAGNMGMWCGDNPATGWAAPPGYGNGWRDYLVWRSGPIADPSQGQTIDLDFFFNYETEPGYDFFKVEYLNSTGWNTVYAVYGTNKVGGTGGVFPTPGVQYSTVGAPPIEYLGNDYAGDGNDEIVLRLTFTSDGIGADETGIYFLTDAGAVQVDDVSVSYEDAGPQVDFSDFEGSGPFSWQPELAPFVGDFAKIFQNLTDLDDCRDNRSPQMTFIDDGTSPSNAPGQSTGGSTSPEWSYGTPGGWTTNDSGGLAGEGYYLYNELRSPGFPIDLPGTEDDSEHFVYVVEWEAFEHHPQITPTLFPWLLGSLDGGVNYNRFFRVTFPGYALPTPPRDYARSAYTDFYLIQTPTHLKLLLRFYDSDTYGETYDATPAPFLDNVRVYKELSGPIISANHWQLFQDAFPANGSLDVSTMAARDALDVRLDSAEDNPWGDGNAAVFTIEPVAYGAGGTSYVLHWTLDKNPLFEDAIRTLPAGSTVSVGTGPNGWDQVTGTASRTSLGNSLWSFDLPDQDFFYPGDRLRYYIEAQSLEFMAQTGGPVSTLPADLTGYSDGVGYDPLFTVRALPTITDTAGSHPAILLVDYDQNGDSAKLWKQTLGQIGLEFDRDVDVFLGRGLEANLASTNLGANVAQLGGYSCVLMSTRVWPHLDDYDMLEQWHAGPGDKLAAFFGDDVVTAAPTTFRSDVMGVQYLQSSASSLVGNQKAPLVNPQQAPFATGFVANAGCYLRGLDAILPTAGSTAPHAYDDGAGGTYPATVASVLWDRIDGSSNRIIDVTFPYGLDAIENEHAKTPGASARAELLAEVLGLAAHSGGTPTPAPVPQLAGIYGLQALPNPFNPRTEISFRLGQAGDTQVQVFDVRGRHVAELHRGHLDAGDHRLLWSGQSARGESVASGVYFVQVEAGFYREQIKITLIE